MKSTPSTNDSVRLFSGRILLAACVAFLAAIDVPGADAQTITTVAGNGTADYSGDGGAATSAKLSFPYGVTVDGSGNLYIADRANHRIRKVDPSGTITTVAGTGTDGYSGDNGSATSAMLDDPIGVTVDVSGNLYIADFYNQRIRKVDTGGTITTVAGNGTSGYSGDGGAATSARLNHPTNVAVDSSGNLYIADFANHRIRKVDTSGTITTVAGYGSQGYSGDNGAATSARLSSPFGVTVDGSGNLYIADELNHRIRKVDTSGTITTVAGNGSEGFSGDGGAATSAGLYRPRGVTVDVSGNLYIADCSNHRIRKVDTSGIITTVAGDGTSGYSGDGGTATSARLFCPCGVTLDGSSNLYIADVSNHRVRRVEQVTQPYAPRLFGLMIGQNDKLFTEPNRGVRGNKGAQAVFDLLSDQESWAAANEGNSSGIIEFFESRKPGVAESIIDQLDGMQVRTGDTLVFYYCGHGGQWWTRDGDPDPSNEEPDGQGDTADEFLSCGLTDDDLYRIFSQSKWAGVRKVFFLDTCHGGGFLGNFSNDDAGDLEKLGNYAFFASATEEGTAKAKKHLFDNGELDPDGGMGVWTYENLLEVLAYQNGDISGDSLVNHYNTHVDATVQKYEGQLLPLLEENLNPPGSTAVFDGMDMVYGFSPDFDMSASLIPKARTTAQPTVAQPAAPSPNAALKSALANKIKKLKKKAAKAKKKKRKGTARRLALKIKKLQRRLRSL